nr:hypothetical protein [uncultured Flavobacterium sp.]
MLVFIHANFKLDLTHYSVTFSSVNQWFKDDFSTEITFPFEFYLDSDISKSSGFDAHYNAASNIRVFKGIIDKDGVFVDAELKFESIVGKKVSAMIRAGISNFPSFDKKLSELPLEQKEVTNIVEEALTTIVKSYPATNYNFPMVHTNKYNSGGEDWYGFENIINHYADGNFLENEINTSTDVDVIKNIMQPLPYKMHVLKAGIESAGYTLAGDILNDVDLNNGLLFRDGDYYERLSEDLIDFKFNNNQWDFLDNNKSNIQHVKFVKEIEIQRKGDYNIYGDVFSLNYIQITGGESFFVSDISIKILKITPGGSSEIYNFYRIGEDRPSLTNRFKRTLSRSIDIDVSLNVGDKIQIIKIEAKRDYIPSPTPDYPEAISLEIIPTRYRNPDGSPILSVKNLNKIDLKRVVPDITFRDFVTAIKNWGNYGFVPLGKVIFMNIINPDLDRANAVDLSDLDIPEPKRTLHDERLFEILFADGKNHETYKYDSVLVSKTGTVINNYITNDNVNSIKIDALPLPVITRNSVTTALSFEDETSKIRVVYMRNMPEEGLPVCYENKNVLIPNIAETKFKNWLNFRINSVGWEWDYLISVEKFREISIQSLIYAYSNFHIFTESQEERISDNWWRVSAKSESLN